MRSSASRSLTRMPARADDAVVIETEKGTGTLPNDTVIVCAGGILPTAFLKDVGIEVEFNVVEWQALLDIWRAGAKSPQAAGSHGVNVSYTTQDPYSAFTRFLRSDLAAPAGVSFGYYSDPEMNKLLKEVQLTFDPAKRDEILAKVHTKEVNEALFLWVVHDVAPRAMSCDATSTRLETSQAPAAWMPSTARLCAS